MTNTVDGILIRKQGQAGRITLNRPDALNALSYEMCLAIEAALDQWREDPEVALVIIDGAGRSFCAGGDIVEMYRTARAGDFEYGRRFWADEYRLNAKIFEYPKPYVAFMQGFTMGGGVGISCHGTFRIVGETSKIAMPECSIGLVPDVGGSLLLALAPGRLGEYLGTTAARMGPADAIYAGFADTFIAEEKWPEVIEALCQTGTTDAILPAASDPGPAPLADRQEFIDFHFGGETMRDILRSLKSASDQDQRAIADAFAKVSPLAATATIELIHRVRGVESIGAALEQEYRFTYRAAEDGDFVEGIRARIIDKDNAPNWRHADIHSVPDIAATKMLLPLGSKKLNLKETP